MSDDYGVRAIAISDEFCNKARNLNLSLYMEIYGYNNNNTVFHLSDEQYAQMYEAFNMLQMVSTVGKAWKENMTLYAFLNIIMLYHEFCPHKVEKEKKPVPGLAARFQQVAYLMGFNDQGSFMRFFKKHVGITPKEYRNKPKTS